MLPVRSIDCLSIEIHVIPKKIVNIHNDAQCTKFTSFTMSNMLLFFVFFLLYFVWPALDGPQTKYLLLCLIIFIYSTTNDTMQPLNVESFCTLISDSSSLWYKKSIFTIFLFGFCCWLFCWIRWKKCSETFTIHTKKKNKYVCCMYYIRWCNKF